MVSNYLHVSESTTVTLGPTVLPSNLTALIQLAGVGLKMKPLNTTSFDVLLSKVREQSFLIKLVKFLSVLFRFSKRCLLMSADTLW